MLTTKNQPHHRNEVSQNALFQNRMCFIYRKMTFLGQNLAENRKRNMYHTKRVIDIQIIRQFHKTTPALF